MRAVLSERMKMLRTWLVPLSVLGPLGVLGLTAILWALKTEWLHEKVANQGAWVAVMNEIGMLEICAITLGAAILASLVFDLDHRAAGWKQLFALPVSRTKLYLVKTAEVCALLLGSSALMALGVIAVWTWQDLGTLPWSDLGVLVVMVWVAVSPVVAIQSALSAHVRNQAFSLIIGVAGSIFSLFGNIELLPEWLPWLMVSRAMDWVVHGEGDPWQITGVAFGTALVVSVASATVYARRDVV